MTEWRPDQALRDPGLGGLVLAAGRSTRMPGGSKLLRDFRGTSVIRRVVSTAAAADLDPIVIVVRPGDRAVRSKLQGLAVHFAEVSAATEGRLVSAVTGALALAEQSVGGAIILLGDEPGLALDHVRTVAAAATVDPALVLRASFHDRPGHPVFLPGSVLRSIPALSRSHGPDSSLWRVIVDAGLPHRGVPIDAPGPTDVDTWEDLVRAIDDDSHA